MEEQEQEQKALPPTEKLKKDILEEREIVLTIIKEYETASYGNQQYPNYILKGCLKSLYNRIRAYLDTKKTEKINNEIVELLEDRDIKKNIESFYIIDKWLLSKDVIKFDTEKGRKVF